jgi:outer membrane protein TolC
MKRLYQILLLSLVVPLGAQAQSTGQPQQVTDTVSFTLDQAIQYALENTTEVKNARVDAEISEARVKETVGIGLPQIDGSVSLQHNQKLPRFFANYQTAQGFGGQEIPILAPTDIVAAPNFFQLPSSGNAGLTISQLLFSSSYLVGLKAAGTYKDLAYKTEKQTQIQVIENVTKAYYGVLVNSERIVLFDNNIARVDSLLKNTTALNKNGFAEEIDVDRIKVTLNNLKSERLKFINLQNLSLTLLKFQMNFPMDGPMKVHGSIAELKVENDMTDYQTGWDSKNRIEYELLDTQRKLQELDIRNKYSASLPSLSGFVNMGYSTQSPNISGLFKTNTPIKDGEYGPVGPDKWYSYSLFGITLNVPLFSGLQRNYQLQQSKLSLLKIQNNYTQLKQSIDLSIQQNTTTYQNSLETLKSQQENMTLAEKVARVTKIKYEQGVGSNIEVTDAESSLREAQVNYYNALYDAIIAKVDLDKAYAKIDPSKYATSSAK